MARLIALPARSPDHGETPSGWGVQGYDRSPVERSSLTWAVGPRGEWRRRAVLPICVKTPKGIEEIERRSYRLPMRTRQVLIMVDGKRDYDTLVAMFPDVTLSGVVQQLIDDGFITPLRKAAPVAASGSAAPAVATASRRPSAIDEQRLKMARDVMISTLVTFVGPGAMGVITQLEAAARLEQLHGLAPLWRDALALSPEGRRQLSDLQTRLAVIDQSFLSILQPFAAASKSGVAPSNDGERLALARNFMINTLNAFVGIAASNLIEHVERAASIDELRHQYIAWREAIALTGDGRKRLAELEESLAALVS